MAEPVDQEDVEFGGYQANGAQPPTTQARGIQAMLVRELRVLEGRKLELLESHVSHLAKSFEDTAQVISEQESEMVNDFKKSLADLETRREHISELLDTTRDVRRAAEARESIEPEDDDEASEEEKEEFKRGLDATANTFAMSEFMMVAAFFIFGEYESQATAAESATEMFAFYCGVCVMIFIGFGYLMTFLRRYGFSAIGYTLLLGAVAVQWGILVMSFWDHVKEGKVGWKIPLGMHWLIEGHFAAAVVLISFGAVIGKCTPIQLFYMTIADVFFYGLNFYIGSHVLEASDVGGSMFVHTFGAYFGLASTMFLSPKKSAEGKDNSSRVSSDLFAMIGSVFLWIYWPTFNGSFAGEFRSRVVVNTVMSLTSSVIAAFFMSRSFRGAGKFDMVDIQNATLAGGVAIGGASNFEVGPGGAMVVGLIAGEISVIGYVFITPLMEKKLGVQDTCGIHNLHGMPGVLGGLMTMLAVWRTTDPIAHSNGHQVLIQLAVLGITLGIAITSGLLTSFVISKLSSPPKTFFEDAEQWEVPGEYKLIALENAYAEVLYDDAHAKTL